MVSIVTSSGSTFLMVGSFDNGTFSLQEADAMSVFVAAMLAGQSATTYTPSDLANMGYGDATALRNELYAYYSFLGYTSMVYFNIRRVACEGGSVYGWSDRIDIYVANLPTLSGGALPGDYVATLEFPEGYLALAGGG